MIHTQDYRRFTGITVRFTPVAGLFLTTCLALLLCAASALADEIGEVAGRIAAKLAFSNRGEVLSATGNTLYLSLGQEDGILEGSRFEVVRRGAPLRAGDEILGYEETPVGTAEALRVRGKVTVARLTESTRAPQKGDRVFQLKKGIGRVVVTQFRDDRGFNGLTENLQERLATALVNQGMQVVERSQLERVLREQKLGYSGLIEIGSAKKIGQLLGAEGIVLESIGDLGNTVTVSARLVDLEAGSSVAATEVSLAKTPLISRLREKQTISVPVDTIYPASDSTTLWKTNWGRLELKRGRTKFSGTYGEDDGEIFGTIEGDTLVGYWTETRADKKCNSPVRGRYYWGKITLSFYQNRRFTALWGYCDERPSRTDFSGEFIPE